jgi:hypothetical protein
MMITKAMFFCKAGKEGNIFIDSRKEIAVRPALLSPARISTGVSVKNIRPPIF